MGKGFIGRRIWALMEFGKLRAEHMVSREMRERKMHFSEKG
jgi:hypothetical protein